MDLNYFPFWLCQSGLNLKISAGIETFQTEGSHFKPGHKLVSTEAVAKSMLGQVIYQAISQTVYSLLCMPITRELALPPHRPLKRRRAKHSANK